MNEAINDQLSFKQSYFFKEQKLNQGSVIQGFDTLECGDKIISQIQKDMLRRGVELNVRGNKTPSICKGGNYKTRQFAGTVLAYKGLYCAARHVKSCTPNKELEQIRMTRTKKTTDCTSHVRLQFLGNKWSVLSLDENHRGHCPCRPNTGKDVTITYKEELVRKVRDDRIPIHSVIANAARVDGLEFTGREIHMLREYEVSSHHNMTIQLGQVGEVKADGQFAALIKDLSLDMDSVAFIHYCVNDGGTIGRSTGSFIQIYFTSNSRRKNVLLTSTSSFDLLICLIYSF